MTRILKFPGKKSGTSPVRPVCSLCGTVYMGYGYDAAPVMQGRCCGDCHASKVMPERARLFRLAQIMKQEDDIA